MKPDMAAWSGSPLIYFSDTAAVAALASLSMLSAAKHWILGKIHVSAYARRKVQKYEPLSSSVEGHCPRAWLLLGRSCCTLDVASTCCPPAADDKQNA